MRSFVCCGVVMFTLVTSVGCTKKDEAGPITSTSSSAAKPQAMPAGDGGSMASPLGLAIGKPVEGTLGCEGPPWFVVVPPMDAQIKYELMVPQGAPQFCTHLNARDKTGKTVDSTVSLCSEDPKTFAPGQAPFSKDVLFFTIEKNDPAQACVRARYRLTLMAK